MKACFSTPWLGFLHPAKLLGARRDDPKEVRGAVDPANAGPGFAALGTDINRTPDPPWSRRPQCPVDAATLKGHNQSRARVFRPYELGLPGRWKKAGWKVKIQENEAFEDPHVTVMRGLLRLRLGLRDGKFLHPPGGAWSLVPVDVKVVILAHWEELQAAWDARYPLNPIGGRND
jgi:hypothetical protein